MLADLRSVQFVLATILRGQKLCGSFHHVCCMELLTLCDQIG
jgi:hypothetical protein